MLMCSICGGDATTSGTQCVRCFKFIDINYHGGTIGDGYVVCKECVEGRYIIIKITLSNDKFYFVAVDHLKTAWRLIQKP